jgi:hypothetical protein
MEINLMNMSAIELDTLQETLMKKLDDKLRNMKYDKELEKVYIEIEEVNTELKRRREETRG